MVDVDTDIRIPFIPRPGCAGNEGVPAARRGTPVQAMKAHNRP